MKDAVTKNESSTFEEQRGIIHMQRRNRMNGMPDEIAQAAQRALGLFPSEDPTWEAWAKDWIGGKRDEKQTETALVNTASAFAGPGIPNLRDQQVVNRIWREHARRLIALAACATFLGAGGRRTARTALTNASNALDMFIS